MDFDQGLKQMAAYLLDKKQYRGIGYIGGVYEHGGVRIGGRRLSGLRRILEERGLYDPTVFHVGDISRESGYTLARQAAREGRLAEACLLYTSVITVFILGVLFVSVCTGSRIYGAAASFFSVLLFNFFFTVPRFTLQFNDPGYAVTFAIMFAASFITSTLTVRAQRQARQSSLKAYRTCLLYTSRCV